MPYQPTRAKRHIIALLSRKSVMNILLFLGIISLAAGLVLMIVATPLAVEMMINQCPISAMMPGMTRRGSYRLTGFGMITVMIGSLLISCAFR